MLSLGGFTSVWRNRFNPLSPRLELQSYREPGRRLVGREAPSRGSSCCCSLWRRRVVQPSAAPARNHPAVAQRVERDLKGHLVPQMEGSCPVMPAPAGITGSHLKGQLTSDHVVPWPQHTAWATQTRCARGGGAAGLTLENLQSGDLGGSPADSLCIGTVT